MRLERNPPWMIACIRRTPNSVGSFSAARRGSRSNCALTAILAAVLDVLKIPNTRRRASSKACGAVMPPDQRIDPEQLGIFGERVDLLGCEHPVGAVRRLH